MYGCESWTIKKAERRKIDGFELWCWRRLLSPLDCKEIKPVSPKGNQSWNSIGSWNSNTKATFGEELTHRKRPWCWERLKAGGEGDDRGRDGWMASPTQWTWVWAASGVGDGHGSLACCSPWDCKESDTTEQLTWTELMVLGAPQYLLVWCVCPQKVGKRMGWSCLCMESAMTMGSGGVLLRGGWGLGAPTQCLSLPSIPEPLVQKQHLDPRWHWCSKMPPVSAQWPLEGEYWSCLDLGEILVGGGWAGVAGEGFAWWRWPGVLEWSVCVCVCDSKKQTLEKEELKEEFPQLGD